MASLLPTILSVTTTSDIVAETVFVTPFYGMGVALFILSAAATGLTYMAAGHHVGSDPDGLNRASELTEHVFLEQLIAGVAGRIRYHQRTNARKTPLVTLVILGTVGGVLVLGVGVFVAFTGNVFLPVIIALALLLVLATIAGLLGPFSRLSEETPLGTATVEVSAYPLDGQHTFKGHDGDDNHQ